MKCIALIKSCPIIECHVIFLTGRRSVASSIGGNIKETQEMLDFASKHNVTANVEIIPMDYVNTAMERIEKNDVRYRFVIDIGNTLTPPPES